MVSKKVILITAGFILMIIFLACSPTQGAKRQIIDAGGKKITLIKRDNDLAYNAPALQKINRVKDVRAFEWIDEDTILISKENKNYPKILTENGMIYPQNLYLYNLKTSKLNLIIGSNKNMGDAVLSPDKKHVFYKEGVENLTGFILDLSTKKKIQVTKKDNIYTNEGRWVDNNNVVFSALAEGKIYTVNTKGKLSLLADVKENSSNTTKIKNVLYYNIEEKLYKLDVTSNTKEMLSDDVSLLIPSPIQSQLALVKHNTKTKRTLLLADLNGNELKTIAEGTQIMGTSWSCDGSKLAYTVASENNCDAGLFVVDVKTNKVVQLAVDIQYISDSVKWSPSGKRLLASNFITRNNQNSFVSYIIDLK